MRRMLWKMTPIQMRSRRTKCVLILIMVRQWRSRKESVGAAAAAASGKVIQVDAAQVAVAGRGIGNPYISKYRTRGADDDGARIQ